VEVCAFFAPLRMNNKDSACQQALAHLFKRKKYLKSLWVRIKAVPLQADYYQLV
jgi:hypothetical protein